MIRRPPRSTLDRSSAASDVYKRQDGTGEFFQVKQETMIHSYSLTAAYSFKELLQTTNDITLGFRYSLNHLLRNEEIWHSSGSATDYGRNIAVGLSYKINLNDQQQLILGTNLETKSDFKAKYEIDNNLSLIHISEPTRPY